MQLRQRHLMVLLKTDIEQENVADSCSVSLRQTNVIKQLLTEILKTCDISVYDS